MKVLVQSMLVAALLVLLAACGSSSSDETKDAVNNVPDTSSTPDVADTTVGGLDLNVGSDITISIPDSNQPDTNVTQDISNVVCKEDFAGCTPADFNQEDHSSAIDSNPIVIKFTDFSYNPRCIKVKQGQVVKFEGINPNDNFEKHELITDCGPVDILKKNTKATSIEFTMSVPGTYNYSAFGSLSSHGMGGVIIVVP